MRSSAAGRSLCPVVDVITRRSAPLRGTRVTGCDIAERVGSTCRPRSRRICELLSRCPGTPEYFECCAKTGRVQTGRGLYKTCPELAVKAVSASFVNMRFSA